MITVRFLGTGGARFVVARQIRASGGMWMRFGETQIHVDPGPGALVRALSLVPPCEPAKLDAIVLSHKHLDHANDVNVMAEAMSQGGWKKRGIIFAPQDAFEGEPVVFPYVRGYVGGCTYLEECSGPYTAGEVEFATSIAHRHGVQTYGLHFRHAGATLSYLPCGRLFPQLIDDYRCHEPDVLIVNVLRFRDTMDVDHFTFDDARELLAGVRPKTAILSHFGTTMLERDPNRLARELEDDLGLRVYAARDGWTYEHEYT
ncbi:MAG: MBL fold metallo-hydrolase [Candidatus Velthaea sp.]|jgi:phosphoribosyl 1,2-cyclic phosphodiesterase